jgi:hypothetical protein
MNKFVIEAASLEHRLNGITLCPQLERRLHHRPLIDLAPKARASSTISPHRDEGNEQQLVTRQIVNPATMRPKFFGKTKPKKKKSRLRGFFDILYPLSRRLAFVFCFIPLFDFRQHA